MAEPSAADEAELESSKAPLLEHLIELRNRIIRSVIAFLLCFIVCFYLPDAGKAPPIEMLEGGMDAQLGERAPVRRRPARPHPTLMLSSFTSRPYFS